MRQFRPGAAQGRPQALPRRPIAHTGGWILDQADPTGLPRLDRVQPVPVERRTVWARSRGTEPLWPAAIIDDCLDGRRVYPEPPRWSRPADRLGRLLARASFPLWLFALLACAQLAMAIVDARSSEHSPGALPLVLRAGYACVLTLLPAGVLMWRPDAWRSARLVLGGALLWTTVPALASTGSWAVRHVPALEHRLGPACEPTLAAVAVAACFGPMAVAFGLKRVRHTPAEWLWPLTWRAAALLSMTLMYGLARWLAPAASRPIPHPAVLVAPVPLSSAVAAVFEPLEALGLGILACLCLSAVLAYEPQARLWQCGAAGAVALFGASVYEFCAGTALGSLTAGSPTTLSGPDIGATAALGTGAGLLLLAFTSTVWSAARDAEGGWRGAPDEILAWGPSGWGGSEPIAMDAIVAVAAGTDHALALDRRGRVGAWGDNSMGQTDVPADLTGVVAVAAGDGFSLALRASGTVAVWGASDLGQTDVPADLTDVTAIAAGRAFALALRSDGTVVGWGDRADGAVPVPPDLGSVTAIAAGAYHALALRADGSIVAWGDDSCRQSTVPGHLGRVKAISAGGDFSLALLADGTVVGWGDNRYGQLDIPEGLADVTAIAAGAFHAVALLAQGDIVGWGGGGRQGEAEHPWRLVDFTAVAAGDGFSLAVRAA